MNNQIVFDGDKTINELVEELMEYRNGNDEISGICELEGDNQGFQLEVILRKNEAFNA